MRKIAIILAVLPSLALAAEPPKPTVEDVTAQANALISAVRSQRDACQDQAAQLGVRIDSLTKELAAAKEPKPAAPEPKK